MRRKMIGLAAALLALCLTIPAQAERPRILLYTAYRQVGWGDLVQVGCVDEEGGVWMMEGHDGTLKWPYGWEKQLDYLADTSNLTQVGTIDFEKIFALKSLISSVQAQEGRPQPWACDAGTESSYAVQYDSEGNAHAVLLGMSGDDMFENTDPNAQALYLSLRMLFPSLRCYAYAFSSSWGFTPVPVAEFTHMENVDWDHVKIRVWLIDCEAGAKEIQLSEKDRSSILRLMQQGQVTGKANALFTTGGIQDCFFYDQEDRLLGSIQLYHQLLIGKDGMYTVEYK